MIFGEWPCCGAFSMVEIGPVPCFERIICDECGAVVWLRHSRIDPEMWTDEDFQREYEVKDKVVTKRGAAETGENSGGNAGGG